MKRIEILSPVGNKEMLTAAIDNGADAIYLAGKSYGARKYANNFTNEELTDAIKLAHLYGVKVYVTINTIIYEQEIPDFIEYVDFLYKMGVDAVIMQDIGMVNLVHQKFPDLEIHASTQMHNNTKEQIEHLKKMGVKRVVLPRELSLEEIKNIDIDIEKEVFSYGALCISYSGQCLASARILNRSGNRGECAGICRLPYSLYEDDELIETDGNYLLSPKELNTLSRLREIIDSGVDSLKIEGRMKSPEYVGYVTRVFRRLVNAYYENQEMNIHDEELKNLKLLYNRDFTLGHLFNERNNKLMNIKNPNHGGIPIGKATVDKNKIKIILDDELHQFDGIRFSNNEGMIINYLYDKDMLLINSANKHDVVYVDNKVNLKEDSIVLKTLDSTLIQKIHDNNPKKVDINFEVTAHIDKPLKATITDGINNITIESDVVQKAINSPVVKHEIVEKFSRLNETPYHLVDITIDSDADIFIPVRTLNDLRRNLVDKLTEIRTAKTTVRYGEYSFKTSGSIITETINFKVRNEQQLKYLLDKNVNIYTDDILLYKKYKQSNVYYITDRVLFNLPTLNDENIVASNLGSLIKYGTSNNVVSDIYLNAVNSYTIEYLETLESKKVGLSIENTFDDVKALVDAYKLRNMTLPNLDVMIYGRVELMVLKHCFMNMFLNNDVKCSICKNNKQYYLKDRNNEKLPIINRNCNTYILDFKNINRIDDISKYRELGVNNFTIALFDEDIKDIDKILANLK